MTDNRLPEPFRFSVDWGSVDADSTAFFGDKINDGAKRIVEELKKNPITATLVFDTPDDQFVYYSVERNCDFPCHVFTYLGFSCSVPFADGGRLPIPDKMTVGEFVNLDYSFIPLFCGIFKRERGMNYDRT